MPGLQSAAWHADEGIIGRLTTNGNRTNALPLRSKVETACLCLDFCLP